MTLDKNTPEAPAPVLRKINWDTLEDDLLRLLLINPNESFTSHELLSRLELEADQREQLEELIALLLEKGDIEQPVEGQCRINLSAWEFTATLRMDRERRFWATITELSEEIAIDSSTFVKAFHGDKVLVDIHRVRGGNTLMGHVIQVLNRSSRKFVGTIDLQADKGYAYFVPQQGNIKPDFNIHKRNLGGAHHGDKVQVEIIDWTEKRPDARVIEVIGQGGSHLTEMNAIMLEYGLDPKFPADVQAIADAIPDTISADEIAVRRDFRTTTTFTIDPVDAKDFDDAISFKKLDNGLYEIGVHIADVTHYLTPGTPLDEEAVARATSVYLVDRTIPMLPERLSNHLCSLVPNEDRLVFSAVFQLDENGKVYDEWFGRGIIHSARRFSYEEAQERLTNKIGDYAEELEILNTIAYALREERFAKGSIGFETDEVKFKMDENFKPIAVYRKTRFDAHKLIEDFMLLANRQVAFYVSNKKQKPPKVPFVYRIHDVPNHEKLTILKNFVATMGYKIDVENREQISKNLNRLVLDAVGKPEEQVIQTMAVRSMPKAIYTTKNVGHYGLGFPFYCHFTSPIRRYPDVLAHRILARVLSGQLNAGMEPEALEDLCRQCSEKEKKAADAERASIKFKQVEFLSAMEGQTVEGMVSGTTEWGIFVELDDNKCEGLVPVRDMRDDHYTLDETTLTLVGKRTGQTFRIGDRVRVRIKSTNLMKRQADFELLAKL